MFEKTDSTSQKNGKESIVVHERQFRRTALIGGLYGIMSLVGLSWLVWRGQPVQAIEWVVFTRIVWKVLINPQLADIPSLGGSY